MMYCKHGMKASGSVGRALQKFLNVAALGVETSSLNTYSKITVSKTILNGYFNCQRPQGAVTLNCLCKNRFVQTTALDFPRCNNAKEEHPGVSGSSKCEIPVSFEDIAARLIKCSSVQEQMEELCKILCLSPEELKRREEICTYVKEMLSPFFNNCRVQMYGSSANGLGFKGCDIDMSLSIIGDKRKLIHSKYDDPDIPFVGDVIKGKVSLEYIAKLPQKEQLMFIHAVFLEYYKKTSQPMLFCNGFVPIVRFHHDEYGLKCDLSFGNSVAFRNTKLLNLCGLLDERVTPLMVTIRYWAKHVGLFEGGNSFNKYTMSLLILYFLQTRKPPVLPTVKYLLSVSDYLNNDDMDDSRYLNDIKKIPPSENKQSTVELLKEFFFYFIYFDYNLVMCPLTANTISRTELRKQSSSFRFNIICVQDPIRYNHNVANLVHYDYFKMFFKESLMAVKLFHEDNVFSPSLSNWGILSLLEKPENYSTTLTDADKLLSFQILSAPFSSYTEGRESSAHPDEHTKQAWLQKMSQLVFNVLERALLFECNVEESFQKPNNSQPHLYEKLTPGGGNHNAFVDNYDEQLILKPSSSPAASPIQLKDFPHNKQPSFVIKCNVSHNTWLGREDLKPKICLSNPHCDPLEIEHLVSMQLVDQRKKEDKKEYCFICECYEIEYEKYASLLIKFKPFQRADFNPILGLFLKDYVPKTVNTILKSRNTELSRLQNALNGV